MIRLLAGGLALIAVAMACSDDDDVDPTSAYRYVAPGTAPITYDWSVDQARDFDDFALFWAGEELDGYQLNSIDRAEYTAFEDDQYDYEVNSVDFNYGECIEESGSCIWDYQIAVSSVCAQVNRGSFDEAGFALGEVNGERTGMISRDLIGTRPYWLYIWTQDVVITITYGDLEKAALALRPLNSVALLDGGNFQPPIPVEELHCSNQYKTYPPPTNEMP